MRAVFGECGFPGYPLISINEIESAIVAFFNVFFLSKAPFSAVVCKPFVHVRSLHLLYVHHQVKICLRASE